MEWILDLEVRIVTELTDSISDCHGMDLFVSETLCNRLEEKWFLCVRVMYRVREQAKFKVIPQLDT